MYNTNLTTIRYKDLDIIDLWKKFKSVTVRCSIDAIGQPLEFIRSGANWTKIKNNLESLKNFNSRTIEVSLTPVISILNLWFVRELFEYAKQNNFKVAPIVLTGPDYLALDVIPDRLKELALEKLSQIQIYIDKNLYDHLLGLIENNINRCLFNQTIAHILMLDNNRNEKLFDLLPFKSVATDLILKNYEYQ